MQLAVRKIFVATLAALGLYGSAAAAEPKLEKVGAYTFPELQVGGKLVAAVVGQVELSDDGQVAAVLVRGKGAVYAAIRVLDVGAGEETWNSDVLSMKGAERLIAGASDAPSSRSGAACLSRDGRRLLFRTYPAVNPEYTGSTLILVEVAAQKVAAETSADDGSLAEPMQKQLQAFLSRDGERFVAMADGPSRLISGSTRDGAIAFRVATNAPVRLLGPSPVSPDGKVVLAHMARNFQPLFVDTAKAAGGELDGLVHASSTPGRSEVRGEQFVDDGSILAILGGDRIVRIDPPWKRRTETLLPIRLTQQDRARFSHDGRRLYVVRGRQKSTTLLAFDALNGNKLAEVRLPGGEFSSAQAPNGAGCAAVVEAPRAGDPTVSIHRLRLE